jgi:ATP-dependent Clp protease ATP-binding subunit ClpB
MTSNLDEERMKTFFRPEFLNRIDEVVHFNPLGKDLNTFIVRIQLDDTFRRIMKDKQIQIIYNDSVVDYLMARGFDEQFGARPLKRAIQKYILDPLAMKIIAGEVSEGDKVELDVVDGKLLIGF